ncbi:copper chaperone PCu(A)C [Cellvibrio fibrivorans]|uniref:Copper(I)-binding protein n=1 Tax=Cellvibrio fibrivorans TaxID=126350 RepID=A0ABU1US38_9GAMM|nr:copper chaperone PCu(A)C [Cellvibrio fibrivorans]MDR7088011.1 copper(I)-binding protein [Cellvibrio fibrivorans]
MNYYNNFFACVLMALLAGRCAAQMQVENAWIQLAPPTTTVNAAYMTIYNPQLRAQTIVGVSADCCAGVMLHKTRREGDKVMMDHLDHLVIPAQARVQLAPGGLHLMLTEAHEELTLDSKVKITFSFGDGSTQEFGLDVKQTGP